ncbi:MAG TPA: hypothetical protein VGL53_11530 [Bryobacteraceae bacterium]|jgi:hypothetical protein
MIPLGSYISELPTLREQLESAVAANRAEGASDTQWFEWRIRARLVEEKLLQTAKEPNPQSDIEPLPGSTVLPFDEAKASIARQSLPHAAGLRVALQNRRLKTALDHARTIDGLLSGGA